MADVRVAVAGASGFLGRRLCADLSGRGHDVIALTRSPHRYRGAGVPVSVDVRDPGTLVSGMRGADAAYYLVHSLGYKDFERRDAEAAANFAAAAADVRLGQVIYVGCLGDGELSPHLRSRRTVEGLLAATGVPVTTLRAAVVVGHGGVSWEMTRTLVETMPVIVAPPRVRTRTQPVAAADVIRYLAGVLALPEALGRTFDIGNPDVLGYDDMLRRAAAIQGRRLAVLTVPAFADQLAARALQVLAGTDPGTVRTLLASMTTEAVVRDHSIRDLVPFTPLDYDSAVLAALAERPRPRRGTAERRTEPSGWTT